MTTPGTGETPGTAVPGPTAASGAAGPTAAVPTAPTRKGHHMLKADARGPLRPPAPRSPLVDIPTPDLARLDLAALRALRRDAQQEEADLSYLRRMLHGRIDILQAELHRRDGSAGTSGALGTATLGVPAGPGPSAVVPGPAVPGSPGARPAADGPLVDRLSEILADGPSRVRSSARHVTLGTPLTERVRALAEEMLSEVELSDLDARTDPELDVAMDRLVRYEQQVSKRRHALQQTVDGCSAEITRRYREGEARVEDLLADG
ncbi:hypothetical protein [Streptomyces sp. NPDC020917]|uniref:RsiG family protein n=1 Tax=Streptomyces sp. NPDC020917 TaxID=3365102 RepID=UPI00379A0F03